MYVGGTIIVIDPSMGLERCNYCIANANPAIWVWPLGSKLKWLKVYRQMHGWLLDLWYG